MTECTRCNLQVSYKYLSIPIFFHNYSNFDCIFLRNAINRWNTKRIKQGLEPWDHKEHDHDELHAIHEE